MNSGIIVFLVIIWVLVFYLILYIYEYIVGSIERYFKSIKTIEYLQGYQDALDGHPRRRGTGWEKAQDLLSQKGRLEKLLKDREKQ